jgi:hypothetical protein
VLGSALCSGMFLMLLRPKYDSYASCHGFSGWCSLLMCLLKPSGLEWSADGFAFAQHLQMHLHLSDLLVPGPGTSTARVRQQGRLHVMRLCGVW